ncbi:Phosphatidylinositol-4-phosphate 5-kinase [Plasmodium coatneyi]|uniref:Phosphatidylinositol-4-phosphate 5-kinase n=1 Tax=Plasmodium coatneyi TaxID=208452 RepID=A0A1B1DTD3_9APIC|nr:Phosphatidylinositol-4-phosphate 5-kinase [Plasmodium coatneyi]ANQ06033.1 Phosphatidylinositol-4-phosphate 5-kinase [Plasmodium coatneyi]
MMCTSAHVRNGLHWNLKKEIKEITHLSDEEIAVIHKRFSSISNKGRLDYKSFEKSLGILGTIKNAYLYSSIFKAFDTNDDGYLDFYEFCVAINTMLKGSKREKVKLSYRIVHAGASQRDDKPANGQADGQADDQADEQETVRCATRSADPATTPVIRDYSDYISYEQFKEIVLSINDIKKQLLGTEEKILISQISYTFKSLSMLCDDGKYRMNLKCYRKAVKCNEFLKLLGIHNKVADAFISCEMEKKKKSRPGKSRLDNSAPGGDVTRRMGSNHRVKSFSVSTNTRLSVGKGSTASLFTRGKKKKSSVEGEINGNGNRKDDQHVHHTDQVKRSWLGRSRIGPGLSDKKKNCHPMESIVIQSNIASEGEVVADWTVPKSGKELSGKKNYLNVPRSGDGSRRSRSCVTAAMDATGGAEQLDEGEYPKKGSRNNHNRGENKNRLTRGDVQRGSVSNDSPVMMTEGSDTAKRGIEDSSRKASRNERNNSYQQSCPSSSFYNSVIPANYDPSESSSHIWNDHSDGEVEEPNCLVGPCRGGDVQRNEFALQLGGRQCHDPGSGWQVPPGNNTPYKCTVTRKRDSIGGNHGNHGNETDGRKNDPQEPVKNGTKKHECEILKAILRFEKKKENKTYVEEYNEYVKGYGKFAEEQEEGYLLELDTYSDGKEELEKEVEGGGKNSQCNDGGGSSAGSAESAGNAGSAYEDMEGEDSADSAKGNHANANHANGQISLENRCSVKGGDKQNYKGSRDKNHLQEDAEAAIAAAEMAAGDMVTRVDNAKYLCRKYFEYKEFLEHSRCPISHSHNGLMMSSNDACVVKSVCCDDPIYGNRVKGGKCTTKDGNNPSVLLEFSSDVIRKKFYIPTSKCHYVMVNENLTKEQVLYHLGNIVVATEDYLSKERDGGGDYNRIFFFFFHVFKYHLGDTTQEGCTVQNGLTYQYGNRANEGVVASPPHRDEPSNESQMSTKNLRANIYYNLLLMTQIVKYFLHTITISQKCSSSYDSIEESSRVGSLNEVSVLLSHATHILATYSKGPNRSRKIYINKSNYYHKLTRRGKLSVSLRQKKKKRNLQKILAVYFGHERWDLVMNMMIGIRLSAIKVYNTKDIVDLFKHRDLLELPTSNAQHRVVFINYAPVIFKQIRNLYGIRSKEYISSVGPEQVISNMVLGNLSTLSELLSEGKSGSLFYFTSNGKYIIKTVCKNIHKLSRALLPKYYEHIRSNPDSLLTRLYGIHCIKYKSGSARSLKKIYFIVMNNFFSSAVEIHRRYDIKGSLVGRTVPPAKREDHTIALKDVDIDELGDRINVGEKNKQKLLNVIKADADFLKENYLLDYSLLFGIHYKDLSRDLVSWNASRTNEVRHVFDKEGKCIAARPFHQCDHGGMISVDRNKIFFFGIIDIFTKWTLKKKFEHTLRTIQKFDRQNISCIHPNAYAERFASFIEKHME